jgi:hypothetical protein
LYGRNPAWISSDQKNNIWITYHEIENHFSGLSKFDGSQWEHWVQPGKQFFELGYSGQYLTHLVEDNGIKWIPERNGIIKIMPDGGESLLLPTSVAGVELPTQYDSAIFNYSLSAAIDSKGKIWFAVGGGVLVFDEPATTVEELGNHTQPVYCYPNPLSNNQILNIVCDSKNDVDLVITDVLGVQIHLDNYTLSPTDRGNKIMLPLDGISPGLYFVGIFEGNKEHILPIIIK